MTLYLIPDQNEKGRARKARHGQDYLLKTLVLLQKRKPTAAEKTSGSISALIRLRTSP